MFMLEAQRQVLAEILMWISNTRSRKRLWCSLHSLSGSIPHRFCSHSYLLILDLPWCRHTSINHADFLNSTHTLSMMLSVDTINKNTKQYPHTLPNAKCVQDSNNIKRKKNRIKQKYVQTREDKCSSRGLTRPISGQDECMRVLGDLQDLHQQLAILHSRLLDFLKSL